MARVRSCETRPDPAPRCGISGVPPPVNAYRRGEGVRSATNTELFQTRDPTSLQITHGRTSPPGYRSRGDWCVMSPVTSVQTTTPPALRYVRSRAARAVASDQCPVGHRIFVCNHKLGECTRPLPHLSRRAAASTLYLCYGRKLEWRPRRAAGWAGATGRPLTGRDRVFPQTHRH